MRVGARLLWELEHGPYHQAHPGRGRGRHHHPRDLPSGGHRPLSLRTAAGPARCGSSPCAGLRRNLARRLLAGYPHHTPNNPRPYRAQWAGHAPYSRAGRCRIAWVVCPTGERRPGADVSGRHDGESGLQQRPAAPGFPPPGRGRTILCPSASPLASSASTGLSVATRGDTAEPDAGCRSQRTSGPGTHRSAGAKRSRPRGGCATFPPRRSTRSDRRALIATLLRCGRLSRPGRQPCFITVRICGPFLVA
jgi:hypothetical protein